MSRSDVGKIGAWLWNGGRLRLKEPVATNGREAFAAGEIVRLDRLVPYSGDSKLAVLYFVSESDPSRSFCMTGWSATDDIKFELLE